MTATVTTQHEIAAGQHGAALRQLGDRLGRISHRQRQGQGCNRDECNDETGRVQSEQHHQPERQLRLQDHYDYEDQDHNAEDEVAWPAIDRLGGSYIIRWRAGGQRQANQGQSQVQLKADDGNEGEDDSCDDSPQPTDAPAPVAEPAAVSPP